MWELDRMRFGLGCGVSIGCEFVTFHGVFGQCRCVRVRLGDVDTRRQ